MMYGAPCACERVYPETLSDATTVCMQTGASPCLGCVWANVLEYACARRWQSAALCQRMQSCACCEAHHLCLAMQRVSLQAVFSAAMCAVVHNSWRQQRVQPWLSSGCVLRQSVVRAKRRETDLRQAPPNLHAVHR